MFNCLPGTMLQLAADARMGNRVVAAVVLFGTIPLTSPKVTGSKVISAACWNSYRFSAIAEPSECQDDFHEISRAAGPC